MQTIYEKMGSLFVKNLGNQMTKNLVICDSLPQPDPDTNNADEDMCEDSDH